MQMLSTGAMVRCVRTEAELMDAQFDTVNTAALR
jgi:hypothetical protein